MDLSTKTVFISRDVHFHENIFPFATDVKDFSDPFFTEVDASASSTNMDTFVTPVSIPDTQSDSSGACNPLNQPSSSLSTPLDSLTILVFLLTLLIYLKHMFLLPLSQMQILHQPRSPPELTKPQHTYKIMLAIQLPCHHPQFLLMPQAHHMTLQSA